MKFGIEIEMGGVTRSTLVTALRAAGIACFDAGYSHQTTAEWKVVSDASLSIVGGLELVSPILEGENGFDQIKTVCRVIAENGGIVNKSCGFHVHVDARMMSLDELKNVCRDFIKHESGFDSLVSLSRRNSRWAQGHTDRRSEDVAFAQITAATSINNLINAMNCSGSRYHKLNLHSLLRHNTVEFRQHQGTIDAAKIIAWVKLCTGLVAGVKGKKTTIKLTKKDLRFKMLLGVVDAETRSFLKQRAAHFAASN